MCKKGTEHHAVQETNKITSKKQNPSKKENLHRADHRRISQWSKMKKRIKQRNKAVLDFNPKYKT